MSLIKNTINIIFLGQSKILKKSIEAARSLGIKNITIISLKKKIQPNNSINLKNMQKKIILDISKLSILIQINLSII